VQNQLQGLVNGSVAVSAQYAGLQGVNNTRVGIFAGGTGLPTVFDNFAVTEALPEFPQQISLDKPEYRPGETITVSLSPEDEAPASVVLGTETLAVTSATAGGCQIVIPGIAEFTPGGDAEGILLGQPIELTLSFASAADVTTTLTVLPPENANQPDSQYWFLRGNDSGTGIFANVDEDDSLLVKVTQGTITGFTEEGKVQGSKPWTIELYRFSETGWVLVDSIYSGLGWDLVGTFSSNALAARANRRFKDTDSGELVNEQVTVTVISSIPDLSAEIVDGFLEVELPPDADLLPGTPVLLAIYTSPTRMALRPATVIDRDAE
jgi:hypothetical protein